MLNEAFMYDIVDDKTNSFAGGVPFMNAQESWPVDREGNPLNFLVQFDLSEVSQTLLDKLSLPNVGVLQFFTVNDFLYGMEDYYNERNNPGYVRHVVDGVDDSVLSVFTGEFTMVDAPLSRIYLKGNRVDLPYHYSDLINGPDDFDEDDDFYETMANGRNMFFLGGCPAFTQDDFRDEDTKDDVVLLNVNADSELIHIGDSGIGSFWFPKDKVGDLSSVYFYYDCH